MFKKIIFLFIIFYYSNSYSQGSDVPDATPLLELLPELTPAQKRAQEAKQARYRELKARRIEADSKRHHERRRTVYGRYRRRRDGEEESEDLESSEPTIKRKPKSPLKQRKGRTSVPMRYSYSGADCKAVAYFDKDADLDYTSETEIVSLEGLATISYSIYEAKSPVRRLGERAVSGYTKGIRTVAGSMVFLVIEDHPLAELVKTHNKSRTWSEDLNDKGHSYKEIAGVKRYVSTMLKPFNIGLFYKTEVAFNDESYTYQYSPGYSTSFSEMAHLVISGVEIVSEGMVTSVNDMVTEVTMQFVAHDVFNIERQSAGSANTIAGTEKPEDYRGLQVHTRTSSRR